MKTFPGSGLRLLALVAAGLAAVSPAAAEGLVWAARYDSGGQDALVPGRPFRVDPSGAVILAGVSGAAVFLARFEADGSFGKARIQTPNPPFGVTSAWVDEHDRVALSGYKANGTAAGDQNILLMRFAFDGDPEVLVTVFVGPLEAWSGRLVVGAGDGGLILSETLFGHAALQVNSVVKVGGTEPSWSLSAGGNLCYPTMIAPDPSGGAMVSLVGSGTTFARVDASGSPAWGRSCTDRGWPWRSNPEVGVIDAAGNAAVSGRSPAGDFLTARIDPGGAILWSRPFDGKGHGEDVPVGIAVDLGGNVTVTGSSPSEGGDSDYETVRYDAGGTELWARGFDAGGDDRPAGLATDSAGNTWVTGASGTDVVTLEYDASGGLVRSYRFAAPGAPTVAGVAVDGWGNATVAFSAAGDVWALRYGEAPTRKGPLAFTPVAPCRAFDSRVPGLGGPDPLPGPSDHVLVLADVCGVPATARAVSLNLTVVGATRPGNLSLFPADERPPLSSSLNYAPSQTRANDASVGLGTGARLGLRVNQGGGTAHVLIDVSGYWQ